MNSLRTPGTTLTKRDERLIFAMQLLGDKTRFKLFLLLLDDSKLCVNEIADKLSVSASAVSQHFRMFEAISMVSKQREGQRVCYVLREDDLTMQLIQLVTNKEE